MAIENYENGMTISELKRLVEDLPEDDGFGNKNLVWIKNDIGLYNLVRCSATLNKMDLVLC